MSLLQRLNGSALFYHPAIFPHANISVRKVFWQFKSNCCIRTSLERLSTAYVFPANGREGHMTCHLPRLPFAGRCFYSRSSRGRHFSRLEGMRKREYVQLILTEYFYILTACFYSYASFILLLLHELLAKLKEFQIQAETT